MLLLSGHFQGFCRDLYAECSQVFAAALPANYQVPIQALLTTGAMLDFKNATVESIRHDFERFGAGLNFATADPANPARITAIGHLNAWRNAIAHQNSKPPPSGVPVAIDMARLQSWKSSCDGLAGSLDAIMSGILSRVLGVAPW